MCRSFPIASSVNCYLRFVLIALVIAFLAGCGSGTPWSPVPVTGKVTYEDGSVIPVKSMKLYFSPQTPPKDPKTYPREGVAIIDVATGSFQNVTTYKYNDGLIPGKHKVMVVAYDGERTLSPKVPKKCASFSTTPIVIDTATLPLEIKVPKPK
ncbi:MAG TPA: hypothetical protein VHE81_15140 [Lacipirellulaceae bacterium]|nr:hypothetical protein [Lacipirellulaceae bacterium]